MHSRHFGHWFPHKHSFLPPLQLHQIACFLSKQHVNEHFQCKPSIQNNRFCTGNPDPVLTLVAMVLCGLGGQRGRTMWGWHTSLLLLLGQGPASLFPPFSPPHSSWQQLTSADQEQWSGCSLWCLSGPVSWWRHLLLCSSADQKSHPLAACPCIG